MATVYRNLQEQVYENAKDIEDLQKTTAPEVTQNLITETLNNYGIKHKTNELQIDTNTSVEGTFVVRPPVGTIYHSLVDIFGPTYIGDDLELEGTLNCRNGQIKFGNDHLINLPEKSGIFALLEDIPANTGYVKAHTIENDADKNYKTIINLGSGNSGSTLHLEAPGDNGIGSIDIANEYSQGSTSIKFTADKLVLGNTEITEAQLQQLLQLIQNQ